MLRLLLALWLALYGAAAAANGIAVIVNPDSGIDSISREEVSHLFLGRIKHLLPGKPALVIDTVPLRQTFYQALVRRGIPEIDAYWARLRFSGRTQPPLQIESAEMVIERVARDRNAIGYINGALVDSRVKTVLRLDD
jgi:ABC-type phosphate transport system substrate-binding protein